MNYKRILFITDSLGFPRVIPEKVHVDSTWPYILTKKIMELKNTQHMFYYYGIPGLTTDKIVENLNTLVESYQADIMFIQVGIVDCYPHAVNKIELAVLQRLPPIISKTTHAIVKKYYHQIVAYRNATYVSSERFISNCKKIKHRFADKELVILPIAPASEYLRMKNRKVDSKITEYNGILESIFQQSYFGNLYHNANQTKIFLSDGYHLSPDGNEYLGELLFAKYQNLGEHLTTPNRIYGANSELPAAAIVSPDLSELRSSGGVDSLKSIADARESVSLPGKEAEISEV